MQLMSGGARVIDFCAYLERRSPPLYVRSDALERLHSLAQFVVEANDLKKARFAVCCIPGILITRSSKQFG